MDRSSSVVIPNGHDPALSRATSRLPAIPREHDLSLTRSAQLLGALVNPADAVYGVSSEYAPPEYGDYGALSTAIYRANKLRADNIASLPLAYWRERADGSEEEVMTGGLPALLRRPNPHWTQRRLFRMTEWSLGLWGVAFWIANRGETGMGPPSELWWVRPDRMRVVPHATDYIAGFILEVNGRRIPFRPSEVIWMPYENVMDEFSGLSPLASARLSVDAARNATRANSAMFTQGLLARGIISPAKAETNWNPTERKTVEELITRLGTGAHNANRWMILSQMANFQALDLSAKDIEYINQLKWTVAEVSRAYGVPSSMLADNEYSTYSNREQDEKSIWNDTLVPEADFISGELSHKLAPMFPRDRISRVMLDYTGVHALQEDRTEITHQAATWIDRGVPLNVVLAEYAPNLLGEDGEGYPWGDIPNWAARQKFEAELAVQLAAAVAGDDLALGDDDDTPQPMGSTKGEIVIEAEPGRAALALIRQMREEEAALAFGSPEHELRWSRFVRQLDRHERDWISELRSLFARQQESVIARLRRDRGMTRDDEAAVNAPFDKAEWDRKFSATGTRLLSDTLEDAALETLSELGIVGSVFDVDNPLIGEWLKAKAQKFAQEVNETTWTALQETLVQGIDKGESIEQLAGRVQGIFETASKSRAQTIARTEVVGASNAGSLEAARASDVVSGKVWLASLDERVRESHANAHGQKRGLEENFNVGSGSGPMPGQIGVAAEDINCRCTATWLLKDGRAFLPTVVRAVAERD